MYLDLTYYYIFMDFNDMSWIELDNNFLNDGSTNMNISDMLNPQPTDPQGGSNDNPTGVPNDGGPSGDPPGGPYRDSSTKGTYVNYLRSCGKTNCPIEDLKNQLRLYGDSERSAINLKKEAEESAGFWVGYDKNSEEFVLISKRNYRHYDNSNHHSEIFRLVNEHRTSYLDKVFQADSYNIQPDCQGSRFISNRVTERKVKATDSWVRTGTKLDNHISLIKPSSVIIRENNSNNR